MALDFGQKSPYWKRVQIWLLPINRHLLIWYVDLLICSKAWSWSLDYSSCYKLLYCLCRFQYNVWNWWNSDQIYNGMFFYKVLVLTRVDWLIRMFHETYTDIPCGGVSVKFCRNQISHCNLLARFLWMINNIGWSQKMAQLLISHKFKSGLYRHMELHTRQFQSV